MKQSQEDRKNRMNMIRIDNALNQNVNEAMKSCEKALRLFAD